MHCNDLKLFCFSPCKVKGVAVCSGCVRQQLTYRTQMNYRLFLTNCTACNAKTSKVYARANGGKCKACVTGVMPVERLYLCPTCGERRLTDFQKRNRYHCDACTRDADPVGYYNELTRPSDGD